MISPGFTIIGLWIVMMIITFLVVGVFAFIMSSDKTIEFSDSFSIALVIIVVLLELFLCSTYVKFKNNPDEYGYTRIEQEVTEGEE